MYRFVVDGGTWMLPILGASVLGLALVLERAWFWARLAGSRDAGLRRRLLDGQTPPPSQTITDPVARVLVEAVRRPDDLGVAVARAEKIVHESRAFLGLLRLTAGAASLLGLLGTVALVRAAFRAGFDPAQTGTLVANALHPTLLGLGVFLFSYLAGALFDGLSRRLADELDGHLDEVARRRTPIIPVPSAPPVPQAPVGAAS